MDTIRINTAYNVPVMFNLAGVDKRIIAWFIDFTARLIIFFTIYTLLGILFKPSKSNLDYTNNGMAIYVVSFLPILFYFLGCELLFHGQSLGKAILGLRVVSIEGYKPSVTQYLIRWVFRIIDLGFISLFFLGYFQVLFSWMSICFLVPNIWSLIHFFRSPAQQRLGDIAAGTVVIRLRSNTNLSDTIFQEVNDSYKVKYEHVLKLSDRDVFIIKKALEGYTKIKNDIPLWRIIEKLKPVLHMNDVQDPAMELERIITDYNFLSTKEH